MGWLRLAEDEQEEDERSCVRQHKAQQLRLMIDWKYDDDEQVVELEAGQQKMKQKIFDLGLKHIFVSGWLLVNRLGEKD